MELFVAVTFTVFLIQLDGSENNFMATAPAKWFIYLIYPARFFNENLESCLVVVVVLMAWNVEAVIILPNSISRRSPIDGWMVQPILIKLEND